MGNGICLGHMQDFCLFFMLSFFSLQIISMFICSVCEQPSRSVGELAGHLIFFHQRLHSDHFLCFYCKKSFCSIEAFKRHTIKVHNECGVPAPDNLVPILESDNVDDSNDSNDTDSVNNDFINDNDVMNNENPRFTLENFVNNLYSDVQLFLAQLYCIPGVS